MATITWFTVPSTSSVEGNPALVICPMMGAKFGNCLVKKRRRKVRR